MNKVFDFQIKLKSRSLFVKSVLEYIYSGEVKIAGWTVENLLDFLMFLAEQDVKCMFQRVLSTIMFTKHYVNLRNFLKNRTK